MKECKGWMFPDHEVHLIDWMNSAKNRVVMNGRSAYQGNKQLAALKLCTPDRRRTAIDVGAHIGLWSYNLKHVFNRVESFEPVAEHRECFEKNVAGGYVQLHPIALGADFGSVSISTEAGSSGNSTVGGPGEIEMSTLDHFEFRNVDFIKIDCEGFEENVLRGGEQTVRTWKPVIVVEQKRDMAARFCLEPLGAVALLLSWGYRVAQEISGDYIMVAK